MSPTRRRPIRSRLIAAALGLGVASISLAQGTEAPLAVNDDWPGFVDASRALHTERYSFGGTNPSAGTENENYYDGDMGDIDGDGLPDRILGSRYGLLHNQGGGEMVVAREALGFLLRGDPGARDFGDDAAQFADIDGDGDLDAIMGGNNEALVAQRNEAGRFRIAWLMRGRRHSALNIINTDVEGDGDVDLVTAHAFCATRPCGGPVTFGLYLNDGEGRFREVSEERGLVYGPEDFVVGLASGDLDRDGDFDLVIAHGAARRVEIAWNDGSGHYRIEPTAIPTSCGGFPQSLSLGDVDDDGDLDLAYGRCGGVYPGGHPVFTASLAQNDGHGALRDVSATHWDLSAYPGDRTLIESPQAKLVDLDHDGDLDFLGLQKQSRESRMHLIVMRNRGDGHMRYDPVHSFDVPGPDSGLGADMDISDLDGDGRYDAWLGVSGGDVRILLNRGGAADGLPGDVPRNLRVVSVGAAGIAIEFDPPPFAATARRYRVHRALGPGVHPTDRRAIKDIARSLHEDEGFAAPLSRHTSAREWSDPDVRIDPDSGRIRFLDRSAVPGVAYTYAVEHIGTENTHSAQSAEVAARIPAPDTDLAAPELVITSPVRDTWTRWPRIALNFGDDVSGVDPDSLQVSFDAPLGALPAGANLARPGDADAWAGITTWRSPGAFGVDLAPPASLPLDRLVTLTARVSDRSGRERTERVRFFVSVDAAKPPSAQIDVAAVDASTFDLSGAASRDSDGLVVAWEWRFDDGTRAVGRRVRKTFDAPGEHTLWLRVRDDEGGVGVAERRVRVGARGAE